MNINSREYARTNGFESNIDWIRISIPEGVLESMDSNLQDYVFKFSSEDIKKLETELKDLNPYEKGFDSLKKKMKQNVK